MLSTRGDAIRWMLRGRDPILEPDNSLHSLAKRDLVFALVLAGIFLFRFWFWCDCVPWHSLKRSRK